MKKHPKIDRGLSFSNATDYILDNIEYCNNVFLNADLHKNWTYDDIDRMDDYETVLTNGSLYGLNTKQKGKETLVFSGVDIIDNLKYQNLLSYDSKLLEQIKKREPIPDNKEKEINSLYENLIDLSIELKNKNAVMLFIQNGFMVDFFSDFKGNER
ncbi:MAG: hypothetical protein ACI4N3_01030 [Alphaproteobacteria bacterium]